MKERDAGAGGKVLSQEDGSQFFPLIPN